MAAAGWLASSSSSTVEPLRASPAIQIGASLLSFHAGEAPPCPGFEIHGAQPRETLWEECGVLVLRAEQSAMDREIRVDWLHPSREISARAHERLEAQSENFWETSWLRRQIASLRERLGALDVKGPQRP